MAPDAILAVRVIPRARREGLGGWRGERLLVRTTAPPLEGRANDAVCRLIAAALGIPAGYVAVIRGARSREKALRISGLSQEALVDRLRHRDGT